jgi:hypothetical protein
LVCWVRERGNEGWMARKLRYKGNEGGREQERERENNRREKGGMRERKI